MVVIKIIINYGTKGNSEAFLVLSSEENDHIMITSSSNVSSS